MSRGMRLFFIVTTLFFLFISSAESRTYGVRLCNANDNYECHRVKRGESWKKLFPDAAQRDMVMRINRTGSSLYPGMRIAIPKNLDSTVMDNAPFALHIEPRGEKSVVVSLSQLAWGAYNSEGDLVRWGPVSGGKGYCPDIGRGCHTSLGKFRVYEKRGRGCFSTKFPVGRGGAPMPYCMFFHGGFALHGSYEVPGYNASHGCVRLLIDDARWLNQEFVEVGTRVIVQE